MPGSTPAARASRVTARTWRCSITQRAACRCPVASAAGARRSTAPPRVGPSASSGSQGRYRANHNIFGDRQRSDDGCRSRAGRGAGGGSASSSGRARLGPRRLNRCTRRCAPAAGSSAKRSGAGDDCSLMSPRPQREQRRAAACAARCRRRKVAGKASRLHHSTAPAPPSAAPARRPTPHRLRWPAAPRSSARAAGRAHARPAHRAGRAERPTPARAALPRAAPAPARAVAFRRCRPRAAAARSARWRASRRRAAQRRDRRSRRGSRAGLAVASWSPCHSTAPPLARNCAKAAAGMRRLAGAGTADMGKGEEAVWEHRIDGWLFIQYFGRTPKPLRTPRRWPRPTGSCSRRASRSRRPPRR